MAAVILSFCKYLCARNLRWPVNISHLPGCVASQTTMGCNSLVSQCYRPIRQYLFQYPGYAPALYRLSSHQVKFPYIQRFRHVCLPPRLRIIARRETLPGSFPESASTHLCETMPTSIDRLDYVVKQSFLRFNISAIFSSIVSNTRNLKTCKGVLTFKSVGPIYRLKLDRRFHHLSKRTNE